MNDALLGEGVTKGRNRTKRKLIVKGNPGEMSFENKGLKRGTKAEAIKGSGRKRLLQGKNKLLNGWSVRT